MKLEIDRIPTHIPGLDALLHGGIPKNRASLVAGQSGTGKTVMALQFAAACGNNGLRALFVTVEERPEDLRLTGESLGFDVEALIAADKLQLVDLMHPPDAPVLVSGNFDTAGLASRLIHLVRAHESDVVIVDSLSALFAPVEKTPFLRQQFNQVVRSLLDEGVTMLLTVESQSDYGPVGRLGLEDNVCDVVMRMRNVVDGKRRRRTVEVHKYRRSAHLKGEYPAALTHKGLTLFPLDISDDALPAGIKGIERYSSGIDGLDEMTDGGWLRDSIVLLRGPTGSGKTLIAGTFALAGAMRGEKVFYFGFEETRTILIRNFEAIGLPFQEHLDKGNLRVTARFPEATSPEDMLIELRSTLAELQPSLIVLDSISAIEHVISYANFRQFMIGVTSALRRHGRSALLTQAVAQTADVDTSAPYLSTMADAILQLGYRRTEEDVQRTVQLYKMRGSRHQMTERRLHVDPAGLRVVER